MQVTQKCQYALRASFELAKRAGEGPVKTADIADAQAIPPRFLEVILSQLKQTGFVASQRGAEGGYVLVRPADQLSVGEIMRFMQGSISPVGCVSGNAKDQCSLHGKCVFLPMWERAAQALSSVYDTTTLQDLIDDERRKSAKREFSYCI